MQPGTTLIAAETNSSTETSVTTESKPEAKQANIELNSQPLPQQWQPITAFPSMVYMPMVQVMPMYPMSYGYPQQIIPNGMPNTYPSNFGFPSPQSYSVPYDPYTQPTPYGFSNGIYGYGDGHDQNADSYVDQQQPLTGYSKDWPREKNRQFHYVNLDGKIIYDCPDYQKTLIARINDVPYFYYNEVILCSNHGCYRQCTPVQIEQLQSLGFLSSNHIEATVPQQLKLTAKKSSKTPKKEVFFYKPLGRGMLVQGDCSELSPGEKTLEGILYRYFDKEADKVINIIRFNRDSALYECGDAVSKLVTFKDNDTVTPPPTPNPALNVSPAPIKFGNPRFKVLSPDEIKKPGDSDPSNSTNQPQAQNSSPGPSITAQP